MFLLSIHVYVRSPSTIKQSRSGLQTHETKPSLTGPNRTELNQTQRTPRDPDPEPDQTNPTQPTRPRSEKIRTGPDQTGPDRTEPNQLNPTDPTRNKTKQEEMTTKAARHNESTIHLELLFGTDLDPPSRSRPCGSRISSSTRPLPSPTPGATSERKTHGKKKMREEESTGPNWHAPIRLRGDQTKATTLCRESAQSQIEWCYLELR